METKPCALKETNKWSLMPLHSHRNPLATNTFTKSNGHSDSNIKQYKVHFVAKRYT